MLSRRSKIFKNPLPPERTQVIVIQSDQVVVFHQDITTSLRCYLTQLLRTASNPATIQGYGIFPAWLRTVLLYFR